MIDFIKKNKFIVILTIIFIILLAFYFIRNYISNKNYRNNQLLDYEMVPKTYGVNEYSNIVLSDEDMAKVYLNDFINMLYNDIDKAYYLVNEDYRNAKFTSIDDFKNYVYSLHYSFNIENYYVKKLDEYTIYGVEDDVGNNFVFKSNGVMQYSVYLDEDTVEIW